MVKLVFKHISSRDTVINLDIIRY